MQKILIANRGEIAQRIIRTARSLGYRSVAVYSEADGEAGHVREADEAVCIGPPPAAESYLSREKIINAAKLAGADAVHPGYGFLAENNDFAEACGEASLVFIGPSPAAMRLMGDKRLAKKTMLEAGVPCIPGYQGAEQSEERLLAEAERIGVPLMVKASAGGGGRGMRLVTESENLLEGIRSARAEASSVFGSDQLILEKALIEPRHVEIQVFADNHGNAVYLGERDCSVQRRHQKVVEEAPSPAVGARLRQELGRAAVKAARACGYHGGGTVEFLVDRDNDFYFLEMNTRLQVEHPVTEMITGQDLVAWQINIACGKKLELAQEEIELKGHAVEVRLYAEDPRSFFLPQTGTILGWEVPDREGVRVDSGIETGQRVSQHYDPILAKVIAWGDDRDQARRRLASALQDLVLLGVNNNKLFVQRILQDPVFAAGEATTAFIAEHFAEDISMSEQGLSAKTLAVAGLAFYQQDSPQPRETTWHTPAPYRYNFRLGCGEKVFEVGLLKSGPWFRMELMDQEVELQWVATQGNTLAYVHQGVRRRARFALSRDKLFLDDGSGHFIVENLTFETAVAAAEAGSGEVKSSINGMVVDLLVAEGDWVETGQTLLVLEAMKMQTQIKAAVDGRVAAVRTAAGDQVKPRQLLLTLASS